MGKAPGGGVKIPTRMFPRERRGGHTHKNKKSNGVLPRQGIEVKQCMDILRTDDEADLDAAQNGKIAVMFTVAYLYEHREEADHHAMDLTLRALLFGSRKEGF